MKSFEERKEAILSRSAAKIAKRKKTRRWVTATCVLLVLCLTLVSGWMLASGMGLDGAAMESAGNMMPEAAGDQIIYGGAEVPECAPMGEPEDTADVICLELYRQSKTYSYQEPEIVDMFLQVLEGELLPPPGGMSPAEGDPIEYYFRYEPEQMVREGKYLLKLTYPDGETIYFTLEDKWLTRQDNQAYILTDEQAMILHKLMEVEWP